MAAVFILFPRQLTAGNLDMALLSDKATEVAMMQEKIKSGYDQAIGIRQQLNHMIGRLTAEIQKASNQHNITEFSEARRFTRIQYNLELVRRLHAFNALLDGKIIFFQEGMNKLAYFNRQLQDDVKILSTVSKMAADTLMDNIDLTLNVYTTATGDNVIDTDDLTMEDLETTWSRCL